VGVKETKIDRGFLQDRQKSPIAVKLAVEKDTTMPGIIRICYWMQARDIPEYDAPFQKVFGAFGLLQPTNIIQVHSGLHLRSTAVRCSTFQVAKRC
jgi:hypothetical protein